MNDFGSEVGDHLGWDLNLPLGIGFMVVITKNLGTKGNKHSLVRRSLGMLGCLGILTGKSRGMLLISYNKDDMEGRLRRLRSCLVGRVIGDNPSAQAL